MTLKFVLGAVAALSLAAPVWAQTTAAPEAGAAAAPAAAAPAHQAVVAKGDVLQTLQASGQFTTLIKLLDLSNLSGLLKRPQPITIFAPTDAAFAADPSLAALMQPGNPQLQTRVTYLIFNSGLDYSQLEGKGGPIAGAAGPIYVDGNLNTVNDAKLLQPEVKATNGSIYVIDKVIKPGYTPAAPAPAAAQ